MPAAAEGEEPGARVHDAVEHGDEERERVARDELAVGLGKARAGGEAPERDLLQHGAHEHHEERRRHPFAADIGDHDAEPMLVEMEHVVEIAADHAGLAHEGVALVAHVAGEGGGEDGLLQRARDAELLVDLVLRLHEIGIDGRKLERARRDLRLELRLVAQQPLVQVHVVEADADRRAEDVDQRQTIGIERRTRREDRPPPSGCRACGSDG